MSPTEASASSRFELRHLEVLPRDVGDIIARTLNIEEFHNIFIKAGSVVLHNKLTLGVAIRVALPGKLPSHRERALEAIKSVRE